MLEQRSRYDVPTFPAALRALCSALLLLLLHLLLHQQDSPGVRGGLDPAHLQPHASPQQHPHLLHGHLLPRLHLPLHPRLRRQHLLPVEVAVHLLLDSFIPGLSSLPTGPGLISWPPTAWPFLSPCWQCAGGHQRCISQATNTT